MNTVRDSLKALREIERERIRERERERDQSDKEEKSLILNRHSVYF